MASRDCIDCGVTIATGTRCAACRRPSDAARSAARRANGYTNAERRRRADAVAAHHAEHGDWCPGWRRDPHHATDLTADHVRPVAHGGQRGPLEVLCRVCNATKGAST